MPTILLNIYYIKNSFHLAVTSLLQTFEMHLKNDSEYNLFTGIFAVTTNENITINK